MRKNGHYFKFQLIYFLFVSAIGFFFPYFNVYLEQNLGFSGSEIGLVISISLLASVMISPLWGALSDRTGKYKSLLRILLLSYAVLVWLLYQMTALFWVVLFTTLMEIVGIGLSPMLDVLAIDYCERTGRDFGKLRIAGSMGWIFGSYITGFLITNLLFDVGIAMFYPLLGFIGLTLFLVLFIPDLEKKEPLEEMASNKKKPSIKLLFQNKAFVFLMIFNFLTLAIIDSVVAFAGNHLVLTLGAEPSAIGLMNVIASAPEIIFFLFATKLMLKMGVKKFYTLAVTTLIIRFLIYGFTDSVTLFLIAGAVGPLMMTAGAIGNFLYIKKHVPKNLTGTAFVVNVAISTLGRAMFSLFFGIIYDFFGSFMLFKLSSIFVVIALLILLPTKHFNVFDEAIQPAQISED